MKSLYYFILTGLLIVLFSGCENSTNSDTEPLVIDLNLLVQTQEDKSVSFTPVPITSDVFLSTLGQPAQGDIINPGFGQYIYVPPTHFNGMDTAIFTLSDGRQGNITFNIAPINDPPLAGDDASVSIGGTTVTISVLANDVDFDPNDRLTISAITQPNFGSVKDNGDGSVDFSPPENFVGEVRFHYEVSDTASASDSAEVSVFVISGDARLTSIELTPAAVTLAYNASVQFKAMGTFADGSSVDITAVSEWTTSMPSLLSISNQLQNKGAATAQGKGLVNVGASFDDISISTTINILSKQPEAPADLHGEYVGNDIIEISWSTTADVDHYNLYWYTANIGTQVISHITSPFRHSNRHRGGIYYYTVRGVNEDGLEGKPSTQVTVKLQASNPVPPAEVTITTANNQIQLSWQAADNVDGYVVYWSNTLPVEQTSATRIEVTETVFVHEGQENGLDYHYSVASVNADIESEPSVPVSITLPPDAPQLTAVASDSNIILNWNAVAGADIYWVYWSTTLPVERDNTRRFEVAVTDLLIINHSGINRDDVYHYLILAVNEGGESPPELVTATPGGLITVTKTIDSADGSCDADCSLREAIIAANLSPGEQVIVIPQGTYLLSIAGAGEQEGLTGDLDITDNFVLLGDGAATTIIDANGLDRVLDISAETGHIVGLTVRNGVLPNRELGGGIRHSSGELQIDHSIITGNRGEAFGGAIANRGDTGCIALAGDGGLNALGGGCPVLTINNSIISDNCAPGSGSAIENYGLLTINNSTISANGFIEDICSDDFGVIHTQHGVAIINHSTLTNNTADSVLSEWVGTVILTNSTIANNQTRAGAIVTGAIGKVTLINSTVSGNNSEQGGFGSFGAPLELANSIVAGNMTTDGSNSDCSAIGLTSNRPPEFTSLGGNLFNNLIGCPSSFVLTDSDITGDADLASFIDNGEPGAGHYPLQPGSQAIDAGDNQYCPSTDQLGKLRPEDGNSDTVAECDIGAIELGAQATNNISLLPPIVNAVGGFRQVTLMWNGVSGAVGYNIYWGENETVMPSSDNVIRINRHAVTNVYVHEGLNNDSTYYYLIKAVAMDKVESNAREVNAITDMSEPE